MTEPLRDHEPTADSWIALARLAAFASVLSVILQIILLATLDPSAGRCPDWRPGGAHSTPVWVLVAVLGAPCALFTCLAALHWRRFARRVVDPNARVPPWFRRGPWREGQPFWAPATTVTACACGIAAAFTAVPLLLIAGCMEWVAF